MLVMSVMKSLERDHHSAAINRYRWRFECVVFRQVGRRQIARSRAVAGGTDLGEDVFWVRHTVQMYSIWLKYATSVADMFPRRGVLRDQSIRKHFAAHEV